MISGARIEPDAHPGEFDPFVAGREGKREGAEKPGTTIDGEALAGKSFHAGRLHSQLDLSSALNIRNISLRR